VELYIHSPKAWCSDKIKHRNNFTFAVIYENYLPGLKHYALKTHGRVLVMPHSFLTSALDGGES
jgi:hypothetical protein